MLIAAHVGKGTFMISKLKKQLDTIFSLYIRLRYSDHNGYASCYTCGVVKFYKDLQCGHFQSRKHLATRFDETNCQVQCPSCNVFKYGEQYLFGKKLGKEVADLLLAKTRERVKLTRSDYKEMIIYYKELVNNLKKEKGLD